MYAETENRTQMIYYYYFNCKWGFTQWQLYYNKTKHTNNPHNTAHRNPKTIKDTLYKTNTMHIHIIKNTTIKNDLPFIPLHCTSLHFTAFFISPFLRFASFVTFLTIFLKLLGLQERVPKASAGSWFQS
jgi:hypothetical protein